MGENLFKPLTYTINGLDFSGLGFGVNLFKGKPDLPEKYIINEHVCVCHWKDGTITKSFKHETDTFNKTVKQAEAYIRELKVEEPKQKPKHMKEEK